MTNAARPTRVRYIILALTVVVAVLLYLDRFCLGYVTPYISEGMRLTSGEIGFMLGAFFLTYAFGQLPAGWLADRFGVRKMLSFYLLVWSVLTALIGFADSFVVLILLRFGCGLFEAGAYPAAAGLIRRWYPYHRRGLASGIVSLGGRIGGAITPALTGFLILLFMPTSVSSLISDPNKDILDARKLARNVLDPPKDRPVLQAIAPRLLTHMSDVERQTFADVAALPDHAAPTEAQVKIVADAVNGWLVLPNLFRNIDLTPIESKLSRQALDALADPATVSDGAKTTRANRLVLEVLYAGSIRQLFGDGWQPVLIIYGAIGVMVAVIFFGFYRDTPRQHFMANEAEAELAESHDVMTEAANPAPPMSSATLWKCILTDVSLWASAVVQFGTNFGWIILGNLLALYLSEVHSVPEGRERGIMASLPFVVSLPMLLVGGFWTDWMTKHYGPRLGRMFPIAATRFVTAGAFLTCYFLNNVWAVVGVLCVMSIVNDMGLPAIWGYNLDVGKRNVGVVLGWGNMWGNLGAFVSPIVLLRLRDHFATRADGYNAIFLTCAGVFVFIGIVSLLIDASKPLGETPRDPAVPAPPPPSFESSAIQAGEPSVKSGAVREGEPR